MKPQLPALLLVCSFCPALMAQLQPIPANGPLPAPGQPPQQNGGPAAQDERVLAPLPPALKKMLTGKAPLNPEQTIFLDLPQKKVLLHTETILLIHHRHNPIPHIINTLTL